MHAADSAAAAVSFRLRRDEAPATMHGIDAVHKSAQDAVTKMPTTVQRRQRGVTLIETATAACVCAVLAASALPSMSAALDGHRLTTATNDLVLAVNLARSAATAQRTRVVLAPRSGADWASGWRVFVDDDDNGRLDTGEAIVREFGAVPKGLRITPKFGPSYSGAYLSFDNVGNLRRIGSGGYVLGRLVLENGEGARSLCFSTLQVRTVRAPTCD